MRLFIEVALLLIFVQDLKSRSVYWIFFPALASLFSALRLLEGGTPGEITQAALLNASFLVIQFILVCGYFSLKYKKWTNITAGLLGWGDILFLFTLCFYLSALNFLFFYIISLVLVLVTWLLYQTTGKYASKQVPLAGLQALLFSVFSAVCWWYLPLNLTSDDWLLQAINK